MVKRATGKIGPQLDRDVTAWAGTHQDLPMVMFRISQMDPDPDPNDYREPEDRNLAALEAVFWKFGLELYDTGREFENDGRKEYYEYWAEYKTRVEHDQVSMFDIFISYDSYSWPDNIDCQFKVQGHDREHVSRVVDILPVLMEYREIVPEENDG